MNNLTALLIGAEKYGAGFAQLPAVAEDLKRVASALKRRGFDCSILEDETVRSAETIEQVWWEKIEALGPDDALVLYFSGHGFQVDGTDWLIPADKRRDAARRSATQRVSTDLSAQVRDSDVGLVLLVIDACRDKADVTESKSASGNFGDSIPIENRFIRFYGCASGDICHVLEDDAGRPYSVFTRALADTLDRETDSLSLTQLLRGAKRRCLELTASRRAAQVPRLNYGETLSETSELLELPVFARPIQENPEISEALGGAWQQFDPDYLHCLVVVSECEAEQPPERGIGDMVKDSLSGTRGEEIWGAFYNCNHGTHLVGGRTRSPPEKYDPDRVKLVIVPVTNAFESPASCLVGVRLVVEADLVVFDVTRFEPGVMLLLGIRSAARRGLSVCSYGAPWQEGFALEKPFNLNDLNLNSHTSTSRGFGSRPEVTRFIERVRTGFKQIATQPTYLDLPAYDALRRLAPTYAAASNIGVEQNVLALCSYQAPYLETVWDTLQRNLETRLVKGLAKANASEASEDPTRDGEPSPSPKPTIRRLMDWGSPQLVSQSLHEQIRRSAACIADWTNFSPSTFMELGVRLAANERGAVSVIHDGGVSAKASAGNEVQEGLKRVAVLRQVALMRKVFKPTEYPIDEEDEKFDEKFQEIAAAVITSARSSQSLESTNFVHRTVLEAVDEVQEEARSVFEELKEAADALHHPDSGRFGPLPAVFSISRVLKRAMERAALERRLAAWLYMEYRMRHRGFDGSDELKELCEGLRYEVLSGLWESESEDDHELANRIENEQLGESV